MILAFYALIILTPTGFTIPVLALIELTLAVLNITDSILNLFAVIFIARAISTLALFILIKLAPRFCVLAN